MTWLTAVLLLGSAAPRAVLAQASAQKTPPPAAAPAQSLPNPSAAGSTTPGAAGSTGQSHAQTQVDTTTTPSATQPAGKQSNQGVLVDQVVATVNGFPILDSDVDEERRLQAFQPITAGVTDNSREAMVDRLIDRELILEEAKSQPESNVTSADATAQLNTLRKEIPACQRYRCETDTGWAKFVAAQGFTLAELTERWRQRMEVLSFIEQRFRNGIRIEPAQIKSYYDKTLLPEYARQHVAPRPLDTVSGRIQQILLEQQVSSVLDDWLKTLKAQGNIRIMKPGEVSS